MPSAFFISDAYVYLDLLLGKRLFRPTSKDDRVSLALKEGVKAKRLLGALRTLWRSSADGAHDPRVKDLKQHLVASPLRRRQNVSRVCDHQFLFCMVKKVSFVLDFLQFSISARV